jgi:hypothetical protein
MGAAGPDLVVGDGNGPNVYEYVMMTDISDLPDTDDDTTNR